MAHTLSNDEDLLDFELLALQSVSIKEYLLLFKLNTYLQISFKRVKDHLIFVENEKYSFSHYNFYNPYTDTELSLFSNLSLPTFIKQNSPTLFEELPTQIPLISKLKQFNFILKSNNSFNQEFLLHLYDSKLFSNHKFLNDLDSKSKSNLII